MPTKKNDNDKDEMRAEYDFRGGVRGKYAKRYAAGTNLVVIADDVAEFFPDSDSVNDALRSLADLLRKRKRTRKPTGSQR
ncbi:hypothetical protein K8I61_14065 [bacterium]|nr:hypothetical protein [bacterium]